MVEEKSISKDETAETDSESALVSDVDDIQVSETAGSVESGGENVESADSEMLVEEDVNEFGFRPDEMVFEDEEDEEDEAGDEDASPIEELVDEEVVVDNDLEMEWYILKVQVNRETSICAALQRRVKMAGYEPYFGDILVPTEDVREFTKSGKQRIVKRKLYPGYIVVKMAINDDTWFLVRETPGIGDFTGAAGKPAPLSADEIKRIIETTRPPEDEESEEPKTAIKFNVGDLLLFCH